MKLNIADIPENAADIPAWLESQLVGPHLGELIAELVAVHRPTASPTLDEALGSHRADVLERGLGVLSPPRIARLLTNPRLLFALQELVLVEGGPYWSDVSPADGILLEAQADRGRDRLRAYLDGQLAPVVPVTLTALRRPAAQERARFPWAWATLATAAALGLAVYLGRPPIPEWGWNNPGILTAQAEGPEYLNRLADAAAQWHNQPHDTKAKLAQRLDELKSGCDKLIAAKHPQLSPDDQTWLLTKCKAWAGKIDDLREALTKGEDPSDVRKRADETVDGFIKTLRAGPKAA